MSATPLVPGVLSRGDWSALVWFAALPWLVHLLRRAAGIETADPAAVDIDLIDGVAPVGARHRVAGARVSSIVLALAAAFVPVVVVLWAAVGIVLALATLLAGSSWRVSVWFVACTAISVVAAFVLNMPWSLDWTRHRIAGPSAGRRQRALAVGDLHAGPQRRPIRNPRARAVRASVRCSRHQPGLAIHLDHSSRCRSSSGSEPCRARSSGAISEAGCRRRRCSRCRLRSVWRVGAAAIAGGFGSDVLRRGFGWRQPFGLLANVAIVIGLIPAVSPSATVHGTRRAPDWPGRSDRSCPSMPSVGDYRVLYLGDPRDSPGSRA